MFAKIKLLWKKLLYKLHLVPYDDYMKALEDAHVMESANKKLMDQLDSERALYARERDAFKKQTLELKINSAEYIQLKKRDDYWNGVSARLSEALHEDKVFGFPDTLGIPGSTVITDRLSADEEGQARIIVDGRTRFLPEEASEIEQYQDDYDRMAVVINTLDRKGTLSRIAKDMVRRGAVSFTLCKGEDGVLEVYYECVTVPAEAPLMVIKGKETGEG